MKTENDFNKYLTAQFKKIKWLKYVKTADKYTPGISDFMLWAQGKGAFLETKLIKKTPKEESLLLKHPFSSKQVSFLRGMTSVAGCPAWGAIGILEEKVICCVPSWMIPMEGNWRTVDFLKMWPQLDQILYYDEKAIKIYPFDHVEELVIDLFKERSKPIFGGPVIHVD